MENQNEKNVEEVVEAKESKTGTEGKKKMKTIGSVELPSDAFLSILKVDED